MYLKSTIFRLATYSISLSNEGLGKKGRRKRQRKRVENKKKELIEIIQCLFLPAIVSFVL